MLQIPCVERGISATSTDVFLRFPAIASPGYRWQCNVSLHQQSKPNTYLLHDARTHRTSHCRQTAIAPGQGPVRVRRRRVPATGSDRYIFAGIANHSLCFAGSGLLRESVAARTSMDVAASSAWSDVEQLARAPQPDAPNQIGCDHFDDVDDECIDLELFGSIVAAGFLAGVGSNRCCNGVTDTNTY